MAHVDVILQLKVPRTHPRYLFLLTTVAWTMAITTLVGRDILLHTSNHIAYHLLAMIAIQLDSFMGQAIRIPKDLADKLVALNQKERNNLSIGLNWQNLNQKPRPAWYSLESNTNMYLFDQNEFEVIPHFQLTNAARLLSSHFWRQRNGEGYRAKDG